MVQPALSDQEDRPDAPQDRGWTRWLAAGTFVVGLVAGALLVGLLGSAPPVPTPVPDAASGPAGEPTSTGEPVDRVEIDPACLRALNAARDIAATVNELGAAASALDAARLDEVIRRLQPLQRRLEENTAACEGTVPVPTTTAPPDEPTPPTPPASPTG